MKTLIIVIFLCLGYSANAQTVQTPDTACKYQADFIKTDTAANTITLYGKAMFETSKVKFKADLITINTSTSQVTANGSLEFSAPRLASSLKSTNKILKYIIGEDTVYIE